MFEVVRASDYNNGTILKTKYPSGLKGTAFVKNDKFVMNINSTITERKEIPLFWIVKQYRKLILKKFRFSVIIKT